MNLDDIPSGSLCVLDTGILIYAEQRANDSLIAAIAPRIGADVLVSADMRFQAIKQLRTYAPSDLKLPS